MISERLNYLKNFAPKIFDFDSSFDVKIFDELTLCLYHSHGPENEYAKKVLEEFLVDDRSWCRVDAILENSQSDESRYYALLILERLVKHKWKLLPSEQRIGIRDYIVQQIISVGTDEANIEHRKMYLNKLECVLIEILKFEWPDRWPEFIEEIIVSSGISESISLINIKILRLLAEEIFVFGNNQMNHVKRDFLKTSLRNQFSALFNHIYKILTESINISLIIETLKTFSCFMPFIAPSYIFDTSICDTLLERIFSEAAFTNDAFACIVEIMSLEASNYQPSKNNIYKRTLAKIKKIIPSEFNFNLAYSNGSDVQQRFFRLLALFFSYSMKDFNKKFNTNIELPDLMDGFKYVLSSTDINDQEIFKICMELWRNFTYILCVDKTRAENRNDPTLKKICDDFSSILTKLRYTLITNMRRPEEVIIYVNEHGEVVRQHMRDTDSISIYYQCKDVLFELTTLDPSEVLTIIFERLDIVMKSSSFNWNDLNSIGWAVGSISGAMSTDMERDFLVRVLKNLLNLCDDKTGKDNKAIVASNIMYVVQQYPRFLRHFYRFLKTVINKLFEFMSETHEGVQDMACDAFLKIAKSCRHYLANIQDDESKPYLETIPSISNMISLLNVQQMEIVYEALGNILSSYQDKLDAQKTLISCFESQIIEFETFIQELNINPQKIGDLDRVQRVSWFLKISTSMCKSSGVLYEVVLSRVYTSFVQIYTTSCTYISQKVATFGPDSAFYTDVKVMRGFKRDFLNLMCIFISSCTENLDNLKSDYFSPIINIMLLDYHGAPHPILREAEVLGLLAVFIHILKSRISDSIMYIFQYTFDSTLSMINKDMQEYPEHRVNFFKLIDSIASSCFLSMSSFSPSEFDYIMQSLFYSVSHTMSNVTQIGMSVLYNIFKNVSDTEYCQTPFASKFYKQYFTPVFDKILTLVTDGIHTSEIGDHAFLLSHLITLLHNEKVKFVLYDTTEPFSNNVSYVKMKCVQHLQTIHPHLSQQQLSLFVDALFCFYQNKDKFLQVLRDFVIQVKEYHGQEHDERFATAIKKEMNEESSQQKSIKIYTSSKESSLYDYHTVP